MLTKRDVMMGSKKHIKSVDELIRTDESIMGDERIWTQEELKREYKVKFLRKPQSETLIIQHVEYLGEFPVLNNTYHGTYLARCWYCEFLVDSSGRELRNPQRGLLEISIDDWDFSELDMEPEDLNGKKVTLGSTNGLIERIEFEK